MDYRKYILPVIINGCDGTCVLIGNMLVTAGHIVASYENASVYISGKEYKQDMRNVRFIDANLTNRSDRYDLAVFILDDVESPLVFADELPTENVELVSYSYNHIVSKVPGTGVGVFGSLSKESRELERLTGKVRSFYDNYFECELDGELCEGRSGSPLLDGYKVVGILSGDKDGKSSSRTVLYLSSKAIVEILK